MELGYRKNENALSIRTGEIKRSLQTRKVMAVGGGRAFESSQMLIGITPPLSGGYGSFYY